MTSALLSLLTTMLCAIALFVLMAKVDSKAVRHMVVNNHTVGDMRKWNGMIFASAMFIIAMVVMRVFAVLHALVMLAL